jgi:hypothetical protein
MNHQVLKAIQGDHFLVRFGVTSNARALHRALERSVEVDSIRLALYQGQIDEETLREFVGHLLQGFQPGVLFPYDVTLAAVAVVLETRPTRLAEELVSELSRVDRPELPMAIRVAQECRQVQLRQPGNISRICSLLAPGDLPSTWKETPTFVETDCDQLRKDVTYGTELCQS